MEKDIIDRLEDDEEYVDAIDDAIEEIRRLRENSAELMVACKGAAKIAYEYYAFGLEGFESEYHQLIATIAKAKP